MFSVFQPFHTKSFHQIESFVYPVLCQYTPQSHSIWHRILQADLELVHIIPGLSSDRIFHFQVCRKMFYQCSYPLETICFWSTNISLPKDQILCNHCVLLCQGMQQAKEILNSQQHHTYTLLFCNCCLPCT